MTFRKEGGADKNVEEFLAGPPPTISVVSFDRRSGGYLLVEEIQFPQIHQILAREPQSRLYHYTSPEALIGIIESGELWATNVQYFSDVKELTYAVERVRNALHNRLNAPLYTDQFSEPEREALEEMKQHAGARSRGLFVASLTEMRDQLSQWRAYCPPAGGYAVGFPSGQLRAMASAQGYYLTPCVYDHIRQEAIAGDLINFHIGRFRALVAQGELDPAVVRANVANDFATDVSKYGPMMKHRSFEEEKEWRLVSPLLGIGNPQIAYRPGRHSIVPYCKFSLEDAQHPNLGVSGDENSYVEVVAGPNIDLGAAGFAAQSILERHFPGGYVFGPSEAPYRGT